MAFYEELDMQHLHTKLAHLSPQDIELLVKAYYEERMPVVDLIAYYALDVQPNTLTQYFPDAIIHEYCEICSHTPLLLPLQNRAQIRRMTEIDTMRYCPVCEHHDKMKCHCDHCLKEQRARYNMFQLTDAELDAQEQQQIAAFLREIRAANEPNQYERFYLTALVQLAYDAEQQLLWPLEMCAQQLTPSEELTARVLAMLVEKEFLLPVVEKSLPGAIYCEDIAFLRTLHDPNYWSGKWTVAEQEAAYQHYEQLKKAPPTIQYEQCAFQLMVENDFSVAKPARKMFYQRMWKELATAHGQFFATHCNEVITTQAIDDALDVYSISEVYTLITNQQLGKQAPDVVKSPRIKPISRAEDVLFTQLMGIGEQGFFTRPTFL